MIIAVNGKSIGGMTLTGLEIEFDLGGPDMTLIVSRYKFPDIVQDDVAQLEQTYINALDIAMNDDRQVGWIDIGATSTIPTLGHPGMTGHIIRPSPTNMDDNSTYLSESNSEGTMDDESVRRIKNLTLAQNVLHNANAVSSCSNVQNGGNNASKTAFVPICLESGYGGTTSTERNNLTNILSRGLPAQGSKLPSSKSNDQNKSSRSRSTNDSKDDDDSNAWCGCVCGHTHQKKTAKHPEIFWIQCDICATWYDCSSTCVGFTSSDAASKSRWICWGCPIPESDSSTAVNATNEMSKPSGRVSLSPVAMGTSARQTRDCESEFLSMANRNLSSNETSLLTSNEATLHHPQENNDDDGSLLTSNEVKLQHPQESNNDDDGSVYIVNDFVFVEEHSWARVNNPEGIATVLKAYVDDDGDKVYDLRYVVGGRANGVLPEYLTRYFFT